MAALRELYPDIEPYRVDHLKVSALHEICYEEAGNPAGLPVVFLHGGPGAGIVPIYRRIFDPKKWRVVLPDQRGTGRSRPAGELRENTTQDLVADLEKLREHLKIPRWMVVGGSWGGTLALAYAQAHPQSVTAMILRGTWLAGESDDRWQFDPNGAALLYPQEYEEFVNHLPPAERGDLVGSYLARLTGPDRAAADAAARCWGEWENCKGSLQPEVAPAGLDLDALGVDYLKIAKFEALYTRHHAFLREGQLLDDMPRIAHIPAVVICGRYDAVTPPAQSWEVARRWPAAEFQLLPATGHSFVEPRIVDAHVTATDRFAVVLGGKR